MSPTVLRVRGSGSTCFHGKSGAHIHVQHADGEAKFWIEPAVELAVNFSLKPRQLPEVQKLIEEHLDEIRSAWAKHFLGGSD